uniref:Uncharacterized protein n=1 Tax=Ditylenchus dipsaci TaxID=166011 RepID=A0A915CL00_9BILA
MNCLEVMQAEENDKLDKHWQQLKFNFDSWIGLQEEFKSAYNGLDSWWLSPYNFFRPHRLDRQQNDLTMRYFPIIGVARRKCFSQRKIYDKLLRKKQQREDRLNAYKNFVQQGQWNYAANNKQDHVKKSARKFKPGSEACIVIFIVYLIFIVLIGHAISSVFMYFLADWIDLAYMPVGNITIRGNLYKITYESGSSEIISKPSCLVEIYLRLILTFLLFLGASCLAYWIMKPKMPELFQDYLDTPLKELK